MKIYKRILCVILLIIFIVVLCNRVYKIFLTTPDIGGIESTIIRKVQLALLDQNLLYSNPEEIYFEVTQYSPLYFWVMQFLCDLFSINAENIEHLYKLNRSFCLLLNLATLGIIAYSAKKLLKLTALKTLLLSVVFFGILQAPYWGRLDSLSLLFFTFFLCYVIKYEIMKYRADLLASLLFLILASLTKQIFIVYYIPVFIYYRKSVKALILITTCLILNIFLFVALFEKYPYIFLNIVLGVNNGYNIFIFIKAFLLEYFIKEGLLYLVLVFYFANESFKHKKLSLLSVLLFFSFTFNLLAALKQGASPSYFTESMLIALFLLPKINLKIPIVMLFAYTIVLLLVNNLGFIFSTKTQVMSQKFKSLLQDEILVKQKITSLDTSRSISFYSTAYNNQSFFANIFLTNHLFPQKDIIYNCAFDNKSYPYLYIEKALTKDLPIQWYVVPKDDDTDPIKNKFKDYTLKDSTKFYYIYKKNI